MKLHDHLIEILKEFKKTPSDHVMVSPSGGGRVLVVVVSSMFKDLPDEERQDRVWRRLIDHLDDEEQARVEFVFTRTPEEARDIRDAVHNER
ncbi:hypothetical protein AB1L88_12665 [Tautonia sp. JC769]|uniref:hypothetical protein n=1 Tax=Tautonia sp. JC769 TaxID=3232135 RepID=UPI00345A16E7